MGYRQFRVHAMDYIRSIFNFVSVLHLNIHPFIAFKVFMFPSGFYSI